MDQPMASAHNSVDPHETQSAAAAKSLPAGVPSLASRWGTEECPFTACNFGTFANITYQTYLAPDD